MDFSIIKFQPSKLGSPFFDCFCMDFFSFWSFYVGFYASISAFFHIIVKVHSELFKASIILR